MDGGSAGPPGRAAGFTGGLFTTYKGHASGVAGRSGHIAALPAGFLS